MILKPFAMAIARRGFTGPASCVWSGFEVGLSPTPIADVAANVTLATIEELDSEACPGYARSAAGAWSIERLASGPRAHLATTRPMFTNTGAAAWTPANCVFVAATIGGSAVLLWVIGLPETLTLGPDESFSPDTDRLTLRWRGKRDE